MVKPELLNNTLWDERYLTDHILKLVEGINANLRLFPENIKRNLELMGGLKMREAVVERLRGKKH